MKQLKVLLFAVASLVMTQAQADDAKIAERIAPVGSVCVQGDESCAGAAAAAPAAARSGEEVYNTACTACHGAGILGAPKKGDVAAWNDRLAKGMDKTLALAISGINAMPPKGNCANCSDDELKAAIEYMAK